MARSRKTGILGGTFDPVHIGHLFIAEAARDAYGLDRVLFLPTGDPPHKKASHLASGRDRINMLRAALRDNPSFQVDDMEVAREGTTYTIDSLKELKERYPEDFLYFIIGGDTLLELKTWKDFCSVAGLCSFIAYHRPGYEREELAEEAERLAGIYHADICFAEGPGLDISSKYIRHRMERNQTVRYLVPKTVEDYIAEHHLYRGEWYHEGSWEDHRAAQHIDG
ncbi:nicotinate-nucleotide adenylyltransferase [Eubacteriales bacterium mix99]|jgi:nicotinate-nucleotide adenylyltransferase